MADSKHEADGQSFYSARLDGPRLTEDGVTAESLPDPSVAKLKGNTEAEDKAAPKPAAKKAAGK